MSTNPDGQSEERWYGFTQVEVLRRDFYVKATSAAEARRLKGPSGTIGVPGLAGNPDSIRVIGRGRLVTNPGEVEFIEDRAEELGDDV